MAKRVPLRASGPRRHVPPSQQVAKRASFATGGDPSSLMSARDEVLGRVRSALGDARGREVEVPRGYLSASEAPHEQVVERFAERVADYRATVRRPSKGERPGGPAGAPRRAAPGRAPAASAARLGLAWRRACPRSGGRTGSSSWRTSNSPRTTSTGWTGRL